MNYEYSVDIGPVECAHCGAFGSSLDRPQLGADPGQNWFCCVGCEAVYHVLNSSGLGQFYDLKKEGVCLSTPTPVVTRSNSFAHMDSEKRQVELYLEGVHCTACLWLIEQLPAVLPEHVASARLDLGRSQLGLALTPHGLLSEVARCLASWGYCAHLIKDQKEGAQRLALENRRQLLDMGIAGALAGNIMLLTIPLYAGVEGGMALLFERLSAGLATVSLFYSGRSFFHNVLSSVRQKQFSIDIPILIALVVAYFYSLGQMLVSQHDLYFDTLSALVFLLLASRYFLSRLRQYGLSRQLALPLLSPQVDLREGDLVTLSSGQKLDFDGRIRSGSGFFNQALLTGESWPTSRRAGDEVYAGSDFVGASGDEGVKVEVVALGEGTRLAKILREAEVTQRGRSRIEKEYDRRAKRLLMFVMMAAAIAFFYWSWQGQWGVAFHRTLALLIVTCPCALAFATPLAQSLILRKAMRVGLFVKDVEAFDKAMGVRTIFFDKTGTLTQGQMVVDEMNVEKKDFPVLRALTAPSSHPVSRAIWAHVGDGEGVLLKNWRELAGTGVEGVVDDEHWRLVRAANVNSEDNRPGVELHKSSRRVGSIFFKDELRAESSGLINFLKQRMGATSLHILSGDRRSVVESAARSLSLPALQAHGGLSPEGKAQLVRDQGGAGGVVLFVGDGVNDALAMKAAAISVAVQGGLETAIRTATVIFLKPGLGLLRDFFHMADRLNRLHQLNFYYSTFYNITAGSLALLGYMNPLLAAVIMPLSAVTVFGVTVFFVRRNGESEVSPLKRKSIERKKL